MRHERPYRPLRGLRLAIDLALLTVVAIGLGGVVLGRGLPALGHPVLVVAGPSMEPAIPIGSAVVLESIPGTELRVDDVVSVRSGPRQAVFTHRIVRLAERDGESWMETRGDANAAADPSLTPASAVIGRVTTVLPGAGYLLTFLSLPSGIAFVMSTGLLLLVLGWWLEDISLDRRRTRVAVAAAAAAGDRAGIGDDPSPAPAPLGVARPATPRTRSRELAAARETRRATRKPAARPSPGMRRA